MAISPGWFGCVTGLPSSSISFIQVLGIGTPMVPLNSVAVTGLQQTEGLPPEKPWPSQIGQPVFCNHSWATAPCTAAPPPSETLRLLQSTVPESGWLDSALNKVLTAGKLLKRCLDSSLSTAGRSRGLGIRMVLPPGRSDSIMFTVNAKMGYSGSAQTLGGCSPAGSFFIPVSCQSSDCSTLAITLRCSSTAPLLTPVVPPVYCSSAMSSGVMPGFFSVPRAPCATASLKRTAAGRW